MASKKRKRRNEITPDKAKPVNEPWRPYHQYRYIAILGSAADGGVVFRIGSTYKVCCETGMA